MRAAGSGRIVNVSSSTVGGTTPGFVPYIASKMGVIGLTRALANDLGDANITVNALALGLTRTAQTERMWEGTPAFDLAVGEQVIKRVEEPPTSSALCRVSRPTRPRSSPARRSPSMAA
jgi:NAD(P)-dependent dehydrogenase (short-subunit alcohol dehydrogenase family)